MAGILRLQGLFMTSISIDLSKNTDPVIADCIKTVKNEINQ
jgi:hypothetical protein